MSKSLRTCQVGWYFTLNDVRVDAEDTSREFAIQRAAHARFVELTRALPCWREKSTHPDEEFDVFPYEVYEDGELEDHEDKLLFSVWVGANREFPAEHLAQFRVAAEQAYAEACAPTGSRAVVVFAKAYREWLVTEWETLA